MSKKACIPCDHYFNGKYIYSYLSINSASKATGVYNLTIAKCLKDKIDFNGHTFTPNLKTNPFIVTTALIRSISNTTFLKMSHSNKAMYVIMIINKVKALIDANGKNLIGEENIFDVTIVTHQELSDVVAATLEELL
jgi:hypothetical protein